MNKLTAGFDFMGLKVMASRFMPDALPRVRLSPNVSVSNEFRCEFDRWLREFFGEAPAVLVYQDRIFASEGNVLRLRQAGER